MSTSPVREHSEPRTSSEDSHVSSTPPRLQQFRKPPIHQGETNSQCGVPSLQHLAVGALTQEGENKDYPELPLTGPNKCFIYIGVTYSIKNNTYHISVKNVPVKICTSQLQHRPTQREKRIYPG
jgi:hypothetical protein